VTATLTEGAFATDDDMLTEEPDVVEEKMAGYDPEELGASTLPLESTIAASRESLPLKLVLGRRKLASASVMIVCAEMPKLNVN
jgi:hypothetical protein